MARTAVDFRTDIGAPLDYARRWLAKAVIRRVRVRVIGPAEDLALLDQLLWEADKEGFVPHGRAGAVPRGPGLERTPVWLGQGEVAGEPPTMLLNLGADIPADVTHYERVVEVVADDPDRRQRSRERWVQYRQLGLDPVKRDGG